jgi:hypothetical protein
MSVTTRSMRQGTMAALLAAAVGCYQSSAPPRWLPSPVEAQRDAFGSWISVQGQPKTAPLVQGELIAIDTDTIHVLADGRLVSLARATVCCAELTTYRMDLSELQIWSAIGTVSTLSHGFVLIVTAPIWALAGTLATSSASYAPRVASTDPVVLRPFARFPQGIPPGLDRATLRSRPWAIPGQRRLRQ